MKFQKIAKIKFHPRKDQKKNGASKNNLKSRLAALNQKLCAFYDFFTDMKFDH